MKIILNNQNNLNIEMQFKINNFRYTFSRSKFIYSNDNFILYIGQTSTEIFSCIQQNKTKIYYYLNPDNDGQNYLYLRSIVYQNKFLSYRPITHKNSEKHKNFVFNLIMYMINREYSFYLYN